jgi:hypothetical protein
MRFITPRALSGSLQKSSALDRASSSAMLRRFPASSKTHLKRGQALAGAIDGGELCVGHEDSGFSDQPPRPTSPAAAVAAASPGRKSPGFGGVGRMTRT